MKKLLLIALAFAAFGVSESKATALRRPAQPYAAVLGGGGVYLTCQPGYMLTFHRGGWIYYSVQVPVYNVYGQLVGWQLQTQRVYLQRGYYCVPNQVAPLGRAKSNENLDSDEEDILE